MISFKGAHFPPDIILTSILRTFFERKGFTHEATNWLHVVIDSHSHSHFIAVSS
jgi:hypothetical protein